MERRLAWQAASGVAAYAVSPPAVPVAMSANMLTNAPRTMRFAFILLAFGSVCPTCRLDRHFRATKDFLLDLVHMLSIPLRCVARCPVGRFYRLR